MDFDRKRVKSQELRHTFAIRIYFDALEIACPTCRNAPAPPLT